MQAALVYIWFFLLYFVLFLFILLDGADLGIGVLALGVGREERRSVMMAAIGPLWYANETWLVIAGAILFGAFPVAYGLLLSSLYLPAMLLVFGLILRAVSIEFRPHSSRKRLWGTLFGAGSLLATLGQGFILGGLLSGLRVQGGSFAGGPWDWLNPAGLLVAVAIVAGYATLGAAYLVRRSEGEFQAANRRLARASVIAALALLCLAVALLPALRTPFSAVWLRPPQVIAVPICLAMALAGFALLLVNTGRARSAPVYPWAVVAFVGSAAAVAAGIFPYFIPFSVTAAEAAASSSTLLFMLAGVVVILPVIVVYSLYVRGVFRGKVHGDISGQDY
jgi:cytochrome d ubiquinol oxidase subunit II